VVVGESPGGKLDKAREMGLTILDPDEFFALLKKSKSGKEEKWLPLM